MSISQLLQRFTERLETQTDTVKQACLLICNHQAAGSTPAASTISSRHPTVNPLIYGGILDDYRGKGRPVNQEDRFAIVSCVQKYLDAVNARDEIIIEQCIRYPFTVFTDNGGVQVHELPIMKLLPADWDRSEAAEVEVVALHGDKAHVLLRNMRRVRADGSLIEEASGFYVFQRAEDGWKMTALSAVTTPA